MDALVACEFSGIVRDALRRRGFNAISCDLRPSEAGEPHYQGDVRDLLDHPWGLVIAHPPCTYLASSGIHWTPRKPGRMEKTVQAMAFFNLFTTLACPYAIENPVGIMSRFYRKPDQIIHPWQYGHEETKATCLWLHALPPLYPTCIVPVSSHSRILNASKVEREKERSRTYAGVAEAMAQQWGKHLGVCQ